MGGNFTGQLQTMKPQLKYIELKTGFAHNGPAWIGYVDFSKSGQTMYFNGRALKGNGHGTCSDIVTREIFWVTGIKKNGEDRHWLGNGKIQIDKAAIQEYLNVSGLENLDTKKYIVVGIPKTDKTKFTEIENSKLNEYDDNNKYEDLEGLTIDDLEIIVSELKDKENKTNANNGLKFYMTKRLEAERKLMELKSS